jgi:hypothetical protein
MLQHHMLFAPDTRKVQDREANQERRRHDHISNYSCAIAIKKIAVYIGWRILL